jgi:hypothetical protein
MDINLLLDWPELIAFAFLIIGLIMAIFSGNTLILYTVCFLMGLFFGRMWYKLRKSESIALFLIIMAFFLGFLLGGIWANIRAIALVLLAGILAGYYLHAKKIIRTI